jgi:hypothetical protein
VDVTVAIGGTGDGLGVSLARTSGGVSVSRGAALIPGAQAMRRSRKIRVKANLVFFIR